MRRPQRGRPRPCRPRRAWPAAALALAAAPLLALAGAPAVLCAPPARSAGARRRSPTPAGRRCRQRAPPALRAEAQAGAGAAAGLLERAGGEEGAVEGEAPKATIFVCTNLQCCQDGAADTRKMLEELAPPGVAVEEITCLGPCGSGPNVYATPLPAGGAAGGRAVDSLKRGSREYPGGVVFTAMKGEGDVGLLEPWGFEAAERTPLDWARLAVRNSQLDQVPWPILLYVGFNVARLVTNLLFHFDLLEVVKDAVEGLRAPR